ncbi:hypothetical protein [Natrinema sp. 1APR25-10V2]|uniref:ComF family protein n=1 Tax=Natrinema sp. 1APR25-10V2 TaxID=2951081 RepID=UPI00287697F7|nr:hypothetical protein [Natrinema sp. 1APR25-10V2]MDS0474356.1 hypothetical protein [Natrinema sp. 1APR25-10V2]
MVFKCKECQRHLPEFMETSYRQCNECTGETINSTRGSRNNSEKQPVQEKSPTETRKKLSNGAISKHEKPEFSAEPEIVEIETTSPDTSTGFSKDSKEKEKKPSISQASRQPSTEPSAQIYFQTDVPEQFTDLDSCDVFAMGRYDSDSWENHKFSKKVLEYCKEDNLDEKDFFAKQLSGFFESRFEGEIDPDIITVYPGHDGDISDGLVALANHLESEYAVEYQQLLRRTEPRPSQKDQGRKERWENQYDSIDVDGNLSGQIVLLLDDIITSGASVTIGKNELTAAGAETVIATCLGATKNRYGQMVKILTADTHSVGSVISNE